MLKLAGGGAGLYDGAVLLLVLGGGIAATLIAFPWRDVVGLVHLVRVVLFPRARSPITLVERMVNFAETARRRGILALDKVRDGNDDPFLAQGIRLTVDGTEPDLIMDILETEIQFVEERHRVG